MATHTVLRTADSILPPIRQSSHGSSGSRANLAMCRSTLPGDVARDPAPWVRALLELIERSAAAFPAAAPVSATSADGRRRRAATGEVPTRCWGNHAVT